MRGELGALRRNTHSAAVAMHGVVELFRRSKRESELHQEVLFFSVTYDCHRVAIYGHFVEIGDQETRYGSVLIKRNDFSSEPKNKWLSYEFTTSLYKIWAQMHLKRIRSVIDGLAAGQQVSKPNALSPGMTSPFNATPTIEAELAPDSTLLGEEAPQPSTLAHINEVCETKSPTASGQNHEDALPDNATHDDFVRYWSKTHSWPTKYFESGRPTKEDILRSISRSDSQRKIRIHPKITVAWSLSLPELDAGPSEPSFISERSAMFRSTGSSEARKHLLKNQKGIWFLQDHSRDPGEGLSSSAEEICRKLTQTEQSVPDSASENEFARILERMRGSGSSRTDIAINIGPKVAPRAETLFANGDDSLKYLTETIDETWSMCASIHKTYPPKPYYAAGFHREYAFTRSQRLILIELNRDLGVDKYHSLFWLAEDMYLPFLTVEPKSHSFAHAENFNIANTLVAMRGVVELFRAANRAPEIHREILAFSAVYTVDRIHMYVHFADVPDLYNSDGQCLRFYRHQVFTSHYMTQGWEVSYRFFKNIYKVFAPMHHARICSAIDSLARKPKVSTPAPADREPVDTVDTSQPQPPAPQSADHTKSLSNNDSPQEATKLPVLAEAHAFGTVLRPNLSKRQLLPSETRTPQRLVHSIQHKIPDENGNDSRQEEQEETNPVDYWRKHLVWPSNFFESDGPSIMSSVSRSSSTRKKDRRNYSKEIWNLDISDPGSDSPETRARLLKDDPVQMFFIKHSRAPVGGLPDEAEKLVQQLKTQEQSVPSFFDERVLELVGRKTKGKNEAKVVQDVGPFVVPHVDHLNYLDYNSLEHLTESVDDVWSHCIPILASNCPKPDYTAGFYWSRFNDNQLGAIARLGPTRECSFSRGCEEQYFPFFTCEAKGTSGDISEARNQSLETALIASRGLIELFQRASLEDKLQRQILCFSAVYDNTTVEIYAHLAHDVREKSPTFYRHQVASFNFPSDRWASYKLVKNIYKIWAPMHGDLICEALDALAKIPGSMAPPSEPPDRSGRSRSRKDLTSDKSPNPHPKKPKTSG
ncbi:hypothetical protein BC567DRAFT_267901 [Phyllosticta citribraziliensis]